MDFEKKVTAMGEKQAVLVRPVEAGDLGLVADMVRALSQLHGDVPRVSEATLARDALGDDPWVWVYLAEVAGVGAGYMALTRLAWLHYGDRGMEVYHLFVRPEFRGQGVGQALIAAAKDLARAAGCVELKVGTHPDNDAAQDYYLSQGFVRQEVVGARFRFYL